MQLPQLDPGGEEAGGHATRRPQEAPQRGDGQVVGQTGPHIDADARPKEAQQRRHEIREGSQVATGAGRDAESETQMHLSQGENTGTGVTCAGASAGTEGDRGTGGTGGATERGEKTVLFQVADTRGVSRAVGEARDEEASQRATETHQNREVQGKTQAGAFRSSEKRELEEMGFQRKREREGRQSGGEQEADTSEMGNEAARFSACREEGAEMVPQPRRDEEQELARAAQVQHTEEHVAGTGPAADKQAGE